LTRFIYGVIIHQERGEKLHDKGDCIDCHQCVTVCPTGIDIRNGIQLECVNCTACIDACDDVMTKIQKPKGLIRYASNSSIKDGKKIHLSARSKAYGVVWLLVMTVLVTLFMNRKMLHVLVLRQPGTTFAVMSHDKYANFFHVQLLNKKNNPKEVSMKIISPQNGELKPLSDLVHINGQQEKEGRMMIIFPKSSLSPDGSTDVVIEVSENGTIADYVKTKFISPNK
jgi:cytochrome c oxidase accessory protein FixG